MVCAEMAVAIHTENPCLSQGENTRQSCPTPATRNLMSQRPPSTPPGSRQPLWQPVLSTGQWVCQLPAPGAGTQPLERDPVTQHAGNNVAPGSSVERTRALAFSRDHCVRDWARHGDKKASAEPPGHRRGGI